MKPALPKPEEPAPTAEQLMILEAIRKDPFVTNTSLAVQFKLTVDQMDKRIRALTENEWLASKRLPSLAAMGFGLRYRIDIKINPLALKTDLAALKGSEPLPLDNPQKILARYIKDKIAEEERFAERVIVEDIVIVLGGPADLCVTVRVRDHDDAFDWVTSGLRATPGIENTSTSLEAWSILDGSLSERRVPVTRGQILRGQGG